MGERRTRRVVAGDLGPDAIGSLAGSVVVVVVTFVVTRQQRLALAALVASQLAWWSAKVIKSVVGRGRPGALLAHVKLREHASGVGYVSGHAAVAFALATVLAPSLPRAWRPVAFAVASAVAMARLYSGRTSRSTRWVVPGSACCRARSCAGRSVSEAKACRFTFARDAQMRPRRSSMWKLNHPGRIGNQ